MSVRRVKSAMLFKEAMEATSRLGRIFSNGTNCEIMLVGMPKQMASSVDASDCENERSHISF